MQGFLNQKNLNCSKYIIKFTWCSTIWTVLEVCFLSKSVMEILSYKHCSFSLTHKKNWPSINTYISQLSIKACPNIWLPKTLTSVQLQPNIAEHCPAMVTYSPSNHSPQCKKKRRFLFLVLSKPIPKLILALSWNN